MWPGLLLPWIKTLVGTVVFAGPGSSNILAATNLTRYLLGVTTGGTADVTIELQTQGASIGLVRLVPRFSGLCPVIGLKLTNDNALKWVSAGAFTLDYTIVFADAPSSLFPANAIRGVNA